MKSETSNQIEQITRDFVLTNDQLEKVSSLLLNEFNLGLGREIHNNATVKMLPTFVRAVPSGKEEGKFLALDLGGTNFRVLLIDINGEFFKMEHETFPVPHDIMLGTGTQLFDHIADCLSSFMEKQNVKQWKLPLGFTFSFPCKQEGLTKAKLSTWTKGFKCSGVEGQDVVRMLREAIARRKDFDIDVMAVVNDTTGTLMSCAHKNRQCRIGVIVGTGTNACYREKLENVGLWDEPMVDPLKVIVNTEWGAFGDNDVLEFVRTEFDESVDKGSLNPNKQRFEKMVSGMYMGEIVRCVLASLCNRGLLFGGVGTPKLFQPYVIDTSFVSLVESDKKEEYVQTRAALQRMELTEISDEESAIATILKKIQRPHTTVGVDGSVYRYHPHFHNLMVKKISELTNPEYNFDLMLSEDGSGRGAALVAAVAAKHRELGIVPSQ